MTEEERLYLWLDHILEIAYPSGYVTNKKVEDKDSLVWELCLLSARQIQSKVSHGGRTVRRFKFYLSIGYANAAHEEIVEIPDDYTDADIDEMFNGWIWNYIDAGYEEI